MSGQVNDPRLSPEQLQQLQIVDFGMEVQAFLKTKIGKYLVDRASEEVERKTSLLKMFDILGDPKGATRLQSEIWRAESFMFWLADAVREGQQLMEQLINEEKQALGIGGDSAASGDITGS